MYGLCFLSHITQINVTQAPIKQPNNMDMSNSHSIRLVPLPQLQH